jgi:hypothetical protein
VFVFGSCQDHLGLHLNLRFRMAFKGGWEFLRVCGVFGRALFLWTFTTHIAARLQLATPLCGCKSARNMIPLAEARGAEAALATAAVHACVVLLCHWHRDEAADLLLLQCGGCGCVKIVLNISDFCVFETL